MAGDRTLKPFAGGDSAAELAEPEPDEIPQAVESARPAAPTPSAPTPVDWVKNVNTYLCGVHREVWLNYAQAAFGRRLRRAVSVVGLPATVETTHMALGELVDVLVSRSIDQREDLKRLEARMARERADARARDAELDAWRQSADRLDSYLEQRESERQRIERDDRRSQVQLDAAERREVQVRFDGLLSDCWGERARAPASDEAPTSYRRSLLREVRDRLGRDDSRPVRPGAPTRIGDLAALPLKGLSGQPLDLIERDLIDAAKVQSTRPWPSTLPPAGEFQTITRTDEQGHKRIEHYGRESSLRG
jgi:hypothetical protein